MRDWQAELSQYFSGEKDLENGYAARPRDIVDLAKGLIWAFQSDISRDALHDYAESRFSPKAVARKYIDLFAQII